MKKIGVLNNFDVREVVKYLSETYNFKAVTYDEDKTGANVVFIDEFVMSDVSLEDIAKTIFKKFIGINAVIEGKEKTKRDDFDIHYDIKIEDNILTIKKSCELHQVMFFDYNNYEEYKKSGYGNLTEEEYDKFLVNDDDLYVDDFNNTYTKVEYKYEEKYTLEDL